MILPKCNHCENDKDHKISFNFDSPDIEKIQNGEMIMPKFRIKCECGNCGKYIKFLPFKDNLIDLNNKPLLINKDWLNKVGMYVESAQGRVLEFDFEQQKLYDSETNNNKPT